MRTEKTSLLRRSPTCASLRSDTSSRRARNSTSVQSSVVGRSEVRDGELEVTLAVPGVLFDREGEVDGGAVFGDEGFALRRTPGDAAHHAAVLLERHLEVPLLHEPRAVHDL